MSYSEFIVIMEKLGYKANWSDERKYITFTTPSGKNVEIESYIHQNNLLKKFFLKILN